jgi:RNA polymerase sigma factor (sigma-70 family)
MRRHTSSGRSEGQSRVVLAADLDRVAASEALWTNASDGDAERLAEDVRAAVEIALTAKQREVVQAYFFEGLSQDAIARRLGITQQVVQKRLYGAVRGAKTVGGAVARLRVALAQYAKTNHGH